MSNNNFDPKSIAIGTVTYYPKWYRGRLRSIKHTDKIRGDLALEFITRAKQIGMQVVVVDGKSSKTFKNTLKNIPGVIIKNRNSPKRSPAKRQAFKTASKIDGVKVIVATEPEKTSVLDSLEQIVTPILENRADFVIPKREEKLFESSYPEYMVESEQEGNSLYGEYLKANGIMGKDADYDFFFGPRAFKNDRKILSLFMKKFKIKTGDDNLSKDLFDAEEYSNAQYFPLVLALKKKMRILSVEIPFVYPKLQKENEEVGQRELFIEKRKNQRLSLILELIYFLNLIK